MADVRSFDMHNPLFDLTGKTALLTGASGYLGRTMAEGLLMHGANLVAIGRSNRVDGLAVEWTTRFPSQIVVTRNIDMDDVPLLRMTLEEICSTYAIDILINNAHPLNAEAGFNVPEGSLENTNLEKVMKNITGGIVWPLITMQAVAPGMKARGGGSIINTASMYGTVAPSPRLYEGGIKKLNPPGYGAAKSGMIGLTRYAASFWADSGIRVNALLPGPFSNTDSDSENRVDPHDPFLDRLRERTLLRRIGKPVELVGPLVFLASKASSYMTGQSLSVDGGWTTL